MWAPLFGVSEKRRFSTDASAAFSRKGRDRILKLLDDIRSVQRRDPACRNSLEVVLLYPGFHAVLLYRLAHVLQRCRLYFAARLISQLARWLTGIEIHPGAAIGRGLFIDHGSGVVIGETTEIGDWCTLYQGVTLGGTGKELGKRHPTLGNDVLIGAGAKVLGPVKLGDHAKVAAGAVVLHDIPENSTAVGVPARVVRIASKKVMSNENLDQVHVPDPVSQELCRLKAQIRQLQKRMEELEGRKE